jgi:hypothetical protein
MPAVSVHRLLTAVEPAVMPDVPGVTDTIVPRAFPEYPVWLCPKTVAQHRKPARAAAHGIRKLRKIRADSVILITISAIFVSSLCRFKSGTANVPGTNPQTDKYSEARFTKYLTYGCESPAWVQLTSAETPLKYAVKDLTSR